MKQKARLSGIPIAEAKNQNKITPIFVINSHKGDTNLNVKQTRIGRSILKYCLDEEEFFKHSSI